MSVVDVSLFGSPTAFSAQQHQSLPLERPAWLCIYLILRGDWVSRDELACLFRPDDDQATARNALRLIVHRARKYDWAASMEVETKRVRLKLSNDVERFEMLCRQRQWSAALELYRTDLLDGFAAPPQLEMWLDIERQRLHQLWREAVLHRVVELETSENDSLAISWLERLVTLDSLAEPVVQMLLRCHLRRGERAEARLVFERFRAALREELNLEPEPETAALLESTSQSVSQPPPLDFPTLLSPLLGREAELETIATALTGAERLVTIVGLGGSGKTHLALDAARRLRSYFAHGAIFVDGASVLNAEQFPQTLATTLGLKTVRAQTPQNAVAAFLADKATLLVLDNFEHLTKTRTLLHRLLETAPNIRLLVTSRVRLGSSFETVLDLRGLSVPDSESSDDIARSAAVRLFLQIAKRVCSLPIDLRIVSRIVQQLEGLPLAVELAARLTRVLGVEQIHAELQHSQTWLETDLEDVPERHRSLNAVLISAWSQLSNRQREALEALSVFRGGATWEALRSTGTAQLPTLLSLINHGLLRRDGRGRFSSHEMIREFAALNCTTLPALQAQHAAFFAGEIQRWTLTPRGSTTLEEMDADHTNLRLAWAHWATFDHTTLTTALPLIADYWEVRGVSHMALAHLNLYTPILDSLLDARTSYWRGVFLRLTGDWLAATEDLQSAAVSLAKFKLPHEASRAFLNLAYIAFEQHQYAEVEVMLQNATTGLTTDRESLAIKAECSNMLGASAKRQQRYDLALKQYATTHEIHEQTNNQSGLGGVLNNIANIHEALGDYVSAFKTYEQSLEIFIAIGQQRPIAVLHSNLGHLATKLGRFDVAHHHLTTSLTLRRRLGDQLGEVNVLTNLAQLGMDSQDLLLAQQSFAALFPLALQIGAFPQALEAYGLLGIWCAEQNSRHAPAILNAVIAHPSTPEAIRRAATQRLESLIAPHGSLPLEQWELVFKLPYSVSSV